MEERVLITLSSYFLNILFFWSDIMLRFPRNYEWKNHMFEEGFSIGLDWGIITGAIIGVILGLALGRAFL